MGLRRCRRGKAKEAALRAGKALEVQCDATGVDSGTKYHRYKNYGKKKRRCNLNYYRDGANDGNKLRQAAQKLQKLTTNTDVVGDDTEASLWPNDDEQWR